MDEKKELTLKTKYLISVIAFLIFTVICLFVEETFSKEDAKSVYSAISNAFTVPAIIYIVVGAFSKLSQWGAYDMFSYALSNFGLHNLFPRKNANIAKTSFYEYHLAKMEKRTTWLSHVFFTGLGGLLVAIVFIILFYNA